MVFQILTSFGLILFEKEETKSICKCMMLSQPVFFRAQILDHIAIFNIYQ